MIVAGIDGCKAGWIVASAPVEDGARPAIAVYPTFAAILDLPEAPAVIAVDMPIGLPDLIGAGGRGPERLVRPLLGERQSSVFAIPARAAIFAAEYGEACRVALATSQPPRKISKQAFFLFPKIREVDLLLRRRPGLREGIVEAHPELAFRQIKGRPLEHAKKIRGTPDPAGLEERRRLLLQAGLAEAAVFAGPPRGAGPDDLIDALALLVVARHVARGRAICFPDPPGRDSHGLPVAIWSLRSES